MKSSVVSSPGKYVPWLLGAVVVSVPLYVFWASDATLLNIYSLFPIFGILAWSLMWTHYVNGSLHMVLPNYEHNLMYKKVTEYLVLALILAHPLLFMYARYRDTGLLPPASYAGYVGDMNVIFVMLGMLALLTFLSYEIFSRLRDRPAIRANWRWVSVSQIIAMILIFIHGLALGGLLSNQWFGLWWVLLGAALIPCFMLTLKEDWSPKKSD